MKQICMLLMVVFELALIAFLFIDPNNYFPEEGLAGIEKRISIEELSDIEGRAEKIMTFATLWIVVAVGKTWLQFRSAVISSALSLPLFLFGYQLSETSSYGNALMWGGIALIFCSSISYGVYLSLIGGEEV